LPIVAVGFASGQLESGTLVGCRLSASAGAHRKEIARHELREAEKKNAGRRKQVATA